MLGHLASPWLGLRPGGQGATHLFLGPGSVSVFSEENAGRPVARRLLRQVASRGIFPSCPAVFWVPVTDTTCKNVLFLFFFFFLNTRLLLYTFVVSEKSVTNHSASWCFDSWTT